MNKDLQTSITTGYDCSNTGSITGTPKSMELETDDIDIIWGIPDNANLDKMNNKLDYYNLENLKVLDNLPNLDISDISGSTCKDDGQYKLTET